MRLLKPLAIAACTNELEYCDRRIMRMSSALMLQLTRMFDSYVKDEPFALGMDREVDKSL